LEFGAYAMINSNQKKIFLGIDPGIAATGFGVIKKENNQLKLIGYGCIKTPAGRPHGQRLKQINAELAKLIKKFKPEAVAVEKLFFCSNVKTALTVGEARGVVMLTICQNNLPAFEYTPLEVKQAVSAYGRAEKMQVQRMVKLLLNMKEIPMPDDAADALAVAICCANYV